MLPHPDACTYLLSPASTLYHRNGLGKVASKDCRESAEESQVVADIGQHPADCGEYVLVLHGYFVPDQDGRSAEQVCLETVLVDGTGRGRGDVQRDLEPRMSGGAAS